MMHVFARRDGSQAVFLSLTDLRDHSFFFFSFVKFIITSASAGEGDVLLAN